MTKNLSEIINTIMEENETKRVLFLTENMHIVGTIHDYYDKCTNFHDCLITLKNVKITKIEDMCNNDNYCECDRNAFIEYKWFNINVNNIIGFSVLDIT